MKVQVITIAAMVLAANVAFAADSTQSTSTASFDSVESILNKAVSASGATVQASTSTGEKVQSLADALNKESTLELRKGGVVETAAGSMSAIGAFTVTAVASTSNATTQVTKITLQGLKSGSELVLEVTEPVAMASAKGVDSSAQAAVDVTKRVAKAAVKGAKYVGEKVVNVGTGVFVGLLASGTVLIEESREAGHASVNSQSLTSAALSVGAISHSAQAFGSEVRQGFLK
jgi:S-adenosylmethionine/arginine decarboxylase-like enzyme